MFLTLGTLTAQNRSVHWISNAGFYIDLPNGDILIDAILSSDDEIARAEGRFADVRLIFVSHVHGDHFNAKGLLSHLMANSKAQAILTPESFNALKQAGLTKEMESRVTVSFPAPEKLEAFTLGEFSGHILQFRHAGVQNIGLGLKGKDITLAYLNGGSTNVERANQFSSIYQQSDIVIANKWPLAGQAYIARVASRLSPSLLLMAHHSGAQDGIVQKGGGVKSMEKFMSKDGMKGRVFTKRMEVERF